MCDLPISGIGSTHMERPGCHHARTLPTDTIPRAGTLGQRRPPRTSPISTLSPFRQQHLVLRPAGGARVAGRAGLRTVLAVDSIALSPGHTVPQNTALTATITLNNLDAASYSSLIFRADLTEFDPHFETESASCEDEDVGEDITIEVDGSQETFTVKVYKACSHDIYAHYTLDAKIFQVDTSLPDGKVQLASASTRFSMSRFLRPGEMTLLPPAPGVAAWLDPDPETFAWYVGEWVQFRARTDVSLYLNHHLGVLAYGSEPGQVADQTSSISLDAEEACREVGDKSVHWRRAINQLVWLVVCKPGTAFIEVRHETDAVAPLREYEFRILARGEDPDPPPPPPPRSTRRRQSPCSQARPSLGASA